MQNILNSKPMIFAAGLLAALLIAQAAAPAEPQPQIGRYQLVPRGSLPQVYVIDTATGLYELHVQKDALDMRRLITYEYQASGDMRSLRERSK